MTLALTVSTLLGPSSSIEVTAAADGARPTKPQSPSRCSSSGDREKTLNTSLSSAISSSACTTSIADPSDASSVRLPAEFASKLVAQTDKKILTILGKSAYLTEHATLMQLARYDRSEFDLGAVIAKGGFSQITNINAFPENRNAAWKLDDREQDKRQHPQKYCLKNLNPELARTVKKVYGAAKDLCMEAFVLSALDHENIIKLRGWTVDGIASFQTTYRVDSFFLVLDKLEGGTLFQKLPVWNAEARGQGKYAGTKLSYRQIQRRIWQEKVQVGLDISSALMYLHSKNIMHRDLKSANVAFDSDGRAKLIDFGLACELEPSIRPNQTFALSGNIGTARYMSPELILEEPYNLSADVYSFSILLWETIAACKPYPKFPANEVKEIVSLLGQRPILYRSWPKRLRHVMQQGWSHRYQERPTMAEVHEVLLEVQAKAQRPPKLKSVLKFW